MINGDIGSIMEYLRGILLSNDAIKDTEVYLFNLGKSIPREGKYIIIENLSREDYSTTLYEYLDTDGELKKKLTTHHKDYYRINAYSHDVNGREASQLLGFAKSALLLDKEAQLKGGFRIFETSFTSRLVPQVETPSLTTRYILDFIIHTASEFESPTKSFDGVDIKVELIES